MNDAIAIAAIALGADATAPVDTPCPLCRAAIADATLVVAALSDAGWIIAQPDVLGATAAAPRHQHRHL